MKHSRDVDPMLVADDNDTRMLRMGGTVPPCKRVGCRTKLKAGLCSPEDVKACNKTLQRW